MDEKVQRLGIEAKTILEGEAFQEAVAMVRTSAFTSFISSSSGQTQEREKLWAIAKATDSVEAALVSMVDALKLEKDQEN